MKQINDRFPHWFDGEFKRFNDRVDRLPFDQHALIALVAPRPVLLTCATEDQWANPAGQFEMLKGADPVYRLLGAGGLEADKMPEIGHGWGNPSGRCASLRVHDPARINTMMRDRGAGDRA